MSPGESPFWDVVDAIRESDGRYRREAYGFVVAALEAVVCALPADRRADPQRRHLSGQELLRGVAALARREFGPLAPAVFEEWGLRTGEDVGAIVFQLVERGQLSARPEDSAEDFRGFDLARELSAEGDRQRAPRPDPRRSGGGHRAGD